MGKEVFYNMVGGFYAPVLYASGYGYTNSREQAGVGHLGMVGLIRMIQMAMAPANIEWLYKQATLGYWQINYFPCLAEGRGSEKKC